MHHSAQFFCYYFFGPKYADDLLHEVIMHQVIITFSTQFNLWLIVCIQETKMYFISERTILIKSTYKSEHRSFFTHIAYIIRFKELFFQIPKLFVLCNLGSFFGPAGGCIL